MSHLSEIYSPKPKTSFDIQYIIISKRTDAFAFMPPSEFHNDILRTLSYLPQNILQLDAPLKYVMLVWLSIHHGGYDLSVCYDDYSIDELTNFPKRQLTILFIDERVKNMEEIVEAYIRKGFFFFVYDQNCTKDYCFSNPIQLINMIIASKSKLEAHFAKIGLSMEFTFTEEIPEEFKTLNKYDYFLPSLGNFFMLNQYIGNLYYDEEYKSQIEQTLTGPVGENWKDKSGRKNRIDIIMKQIQAIDKFRLAMAPDLPFLKKLGDAAPHFAPLILVSPYQYPHLDSVAPGFRSSDVKHYWHAFRTEQDTNYVNLIDIGEEDARERIKRISASANFNQFRVQYLDEAAYLHASYTFSPILRLPLQGPGLKKSLSFLNPTGTLPSEKKLFSMIERFGKEYSNRVLSEENSKKIFGRNRQIVAISDLPVEWMQVDGLPLCVTHDVTRIPEFPYGGIMSFNIRSKVVNYEIPTNILKKTLIVFGVEGDQYFDIGYNATKQESSDLGYKCVHCSSISSLKQEIHSFKPHLIIFDTHGNAIKKGVTSEIQIGTETLTGEDIVAHEIVAPLIILSACSTVPNSGYFNNIANAFFQVGALAITGTFLPIGIFDGTMFYNRILRNLQQAQEKALHSNWLNFISHNIRTNYISESIRAARQIIQQSTLSEPQKQQISKSVVQLAGSLMTEAMSFSRRKIVYKKIQQEFRNVHPIFQNKKFEIPFEQMLYTNLGRGDLVMFSSWLQETRPQKETTASE